MTTKVRIGTCGFGLAKVEYARSFSCVEVQNTFYQPPQIATLERWRQETSSNFEFTLKAWQLITHEARSPTYRRLKKNLSEIEKQESGLFKPTPIVREAWEVTRACAEALKARTILFQCPASFTQTKENISNLEKFFSSIARGKFDFCWEPRGPWDKDVIKSICSDLKLSHVVIHSWQRQSRPVRVTFDCTAAWGGDINMRKMSCGSWPQCFRSAVVRMFSSIMRA
jgi:uncharacterized protein YecE (DUF72 family)